MNTSYWGYWLVAMGVAIVGLMISVQGITTNTAQNYYGLKEVVDASMLEAIDAAYYRDYNEVKIDKEKFMEVLIRKLPTFIGVNETYELNFYALYEAPPKVSVEIKTHSGTSFVSSKDYDTVTRVSAVLQVFNKIDSVGIVDGGNGSSGSGGTTSKPSEGSTGSGSGSNNGTVNKPDTPVGGETSGSGDDETCKSGITSNELSGMHGTAMVAKAIYEKADFKETSRSATPGVKFDILGENGNNWAIQYDGKCGWVDSNYMAINMAEYIPNVEFNITNASSSIYKSSEKNIPGLTGQKLYSSEYTNSWVPGTFSFAKKLKVAAANAKAAGDTIVVNDAYRPTSVSSFANQKLKALYNSDSVVRENIDFSVGESLKKHSWGISWFLAQNLSTHNTGCAVDASLKGKAMPTAMHELSTKAIKYWGPSTSHESKNYSVGMKNNVHAQNLSRYMMSAGLTDLASEWWHYQDSACHSKIGSGANFWSAV